MGVPACRVHGLQFLGVAVWLAACATPPKEIHEDEPGSMFGQSLAVVVDVDGDGVADVVVGCPMLEEGYGSRGAAFLVSTKTGRALLEVTDGKPGSLFGDRVAGPGDLDGDGIPDFMVSAPSSEPWACVLRAYSGRSGRLIHELRLGSRPMRHDRCSYSFCGIGDVDGDGRRDFAVGCFHGDDWPDEPVAIRLFSGSSGRLLQRFTLSPTESHWGLELAPVQSRGRPRSGEFLASFPRMPGAVRRLSGVSGDLLQRIDPNPERDEYEIHVNATADLDLDGEPDVLVSTVVGTGDRSKVTAYSGRTGAVIREWRERGSWSFGSALDVVGDVDGDGIPDLIVTAPQSSVDESYAWVLSGRGDWTIHTHAETMVSSFFGVSCCAVGDVDGDKVPDYLVGAASYHAGGSFPGHVHLYSGKSGDEIACWSEQSVRGSSR